MPGFEMNVFRAGAGAPPLVFVHGLLCRLQDWHYQFDHFAAAHRVVGCDLRGHGESAVGDATLTIDLLGGDVAELLDAEDLRDAVLFGHSMGCRVVLAAAAKAPSRVAGMVLVDGSRYATDRDAGLERLDGVVAERGFPAVVEAIFEQMFFGDPPAWKADKMAQVLAIPDRVGHELMRSMIAWDADRLESVLDDLDMPLLVLQSTATDENRNRRMLAAGEVSPYQALLLDRVAGAESETYADCGHFTMMERPADVNERIARFLETGI